METNKTKIEGVEMICSAGVGEVREDYWPCVAFVVTITRNGHSLSTPYRMGIGHFKAPAKGFPGLMPGRFDAIKYLYERKPYAQLKDKQLAADYAAWCAKAGKITPTPEDVLYSLASDAACDMSFSNWCSELGYSDDSIKARAIYDQCQEVRHKLAPMFSEEELEALAREEAEIVKE